MKTIIITPAAIEPVTLSEAKAQLRIEEAFTLDDDYIESLISAARERCESYCNQFFTSQTIGLVFERTIVGGETIDLPYAGLTIQQVEYVTSENISTIIPSTDYLFNQVAQKIKFLQSFDADGFFIVATTSAPAAFNGVKMAIKMIVADLYALRTETAVGVSLADNPAVKALLYPFRKELGV